MKTLSNEKLEKYYSTKEIVFNEDFISYINSLSESIKEFYKVTKNVNKNKKMLINLAEEEVNYSETFLNSINKEIKNYEEINLVNNNLEKLKDIFNKFQLNINSEEKNLLYFFEDAKILFQKMRGKRKELLTKFKRRSNSTRNNDINRINSSVNDSDVRFKKIQKRDIESYNRSEINSKIHNFNNNARDFDYNKIRNMIQNQKFNKRVSKTLNKAKESINDEYIKSEGNSIFNSYMGYNQLTENKTVNAKSQNIEIQKLKMLNKRLALELKKCKSKIYESNRNIKDNLMKNPSNDIDKDITALSDGKKENTKKIYRIND